MEVKKVKTNTEHFEATCEKCEKEIKGSTENEVRHNMKIHELSKGCIGSKK